MKKLLTLTAACAILTTPATAVQKCVALNEDVVATDGASQDCSDWWVSYSNGMKIKGVAWCASHYIGIGHRLEYLNDTGDGTSNTACYCKMVSPAVSHWASNGNYGSQYDCRGNCAANCVKAMTTDADEPKRVRTAMFSELYD